MHLDEILGSGFQALWTEGTIFVLTMLFLGTIFHHLLRDRFSPSTTEAYFFC